MVGCCLQLHYYLIYSLMPNFGQLFNFTIATKPNEMHFTNRNSNRDLCLCMWYCVCVIKHKIMWKCYQMISSITAKILSIFIWLLPVFCGIHLKFNLIYILCGIDSLISVSLTCTYPICTYIWHATFTTNANCVLH